MSFYNLQPFKTFYALIWLVRPSMISSHGLKSGPLQPKPKLILTELQGLTLSTPSLVYINVGRIGLNMVNVDYKCQFQGTVEIILWLPTYFNISKVQKYNPSFLRKCDLVKSVFFAHLRVAAGFVG